MVGRKIASGIATTALLMASFAPAAFADTSIKIAGNGAFSDSNVDVDTRNTLNVSQSNFTDITNNVDVRNNTGDNSASFNTGGDVDINTGDASSVVKINNEAGANIAHINSCGCENHDLDIDIHGNGAFSSNNVDVDQRNRTNVDQFNWTDIYNDVYVKNNTGRNNADFNTWGDVDVRTGDASSFVWLKNKAGLNVLDLN